MQTAKTRESDIESSAFTLIEMLVVIFIIGLLIAMLQPTLRAARREAKATSCRNNLQQIDRGLSSYTSDYGSYYPSWPGYGEPEAVVVDAQTGEMVTNWAAVDPLDLDPSQTYGHFPSALNLYGWTGRLTESPEPGQGKFRMAMTGLGMLLGPSYMDEAVIYYCPAGMDVTRTVDIWATYPGRGEPMVIDKRLPKLLGGPTRQQITHGDVSRIADGYIGPEYQSRALFSAYNYRNAPWLVNDQDFGTESSEIVAGPDGINARTYPVLTTQNLCPPFKTTKTLQGRAIVMDSFAKGWNWRLRTPGMGYQFHVVGYNVLYGDHSVQFIYDRDDEIVDWPPSHDDEVNLVISGPGAQEVWNWFDWRQGIDVK